MEVRSAAEVAPRLDDLDVRLVPSAEAAPVVEQFHYLRSARRGSAIVAARHEGRIAALCSLSSLDLPHIAERLPLDDPAEAAVVSRVFAFDWAPRNVISYLLARAEAIWTADAPSLRMLVTYLNPNMGFTGASYRAANWVPLGTEAGTRYAYLDGRYITDRHVAGLAPAAARGASHFRLCRCGHSCFSAASSTRASAACTRAAFISPSSARRHLP